MENIENIWEWTKMLLPILWLKSYHTEGFYEYYDNIYFVFCLLEYDGQVAYMETHANCSVQGGLCT